jgi:serine O-acetyltransferase
MINSKASLKQYLEADRKSLGIKSGLLFRMRQIIAPHPIWAFQKRLRSLEYSSNCHRRGPKALIYIVKKIQFRRASIKLGFTIPPNVFGPGLAIVHYGTIIVNPNCRIGKNCRIHACVNIGASGGSTNAPQIGDNVYIGPGAKIYGDIEIGNNVAIAANACVNKSFVEDSVMLAGVPAKVVKRFDARELIVGLE